MLVDPYSTGLMLAPVIHQRGYEVIALWTSQVGENREHLPEAAEGFPAAQRNEGGLQFAPAGVLMVTVHASDALGFRFFAVRQGPGATATLQRKPDIKERKASQTHSPSQSISINSN